ncbi:CIC11C00000005552 [Sungouiella intermedia]|uniref:CIC11C00000005552 n=1 Tax=Sungouiella intermedia TaxID=45354 RepID=A0A1L0D526_9ASCO|nr:CIC11C00000005552 [[Candida] intermedia]
MDPEHSDLYSYTLKSTQAASPRYPQSLAPGVRGNALKIAYRKYMASRSPPPKAVVVNLVFMHGTGMNKGVWHYHIDQLYQKCWAVGVHVNMVLAMDAANHADSAHLNKGKLGKVFDWRDLSYDGIKMAEAESDELLAGNKNVLVGHSMGGFVSLYMTILRPALFDALVMLNPVCYKIIESPYYPFVAWESKGYMETEFKLKSPENWKEHVFKYMRKRSFFREFDDRILENMMADDMPEGPVQEGDEWVVRLKTSKIQTLITYFGASEALLIIPDIYSSCHVPAYRILGSLDTTTEEVQNKLARALPQMQTYFLKGEKHIVQGIHPDIFVDCMTSILMDVKDKPKPVYPIVDPDQRLKL